ncbi:unnamed protein product, partial [Cyprideis torosa]
MQQNFFSVFATYFPSVTGIVAGANISGDLKDPTNAIPKGTLLAIFSTYVSYSYFSRNNSPELNCVRDCDFGIQNDVQAMELGSSFGPLIYFGGFAAALSSAIACIVGAPRVLQALGKDKIYPGLSVFAPDANWGSSTDAQVYTSILKSLRELQLSKDHVKTYRPQLLTPEKIARTIFFKLGKSLGAPYERPPIIDFANLICKDISLMIVGQVVE